MDTARSTADPTPLAAGVERVPAEFAYHDRMAPATVSIRQHSRPERLRRAARAWAGCWGAAIVAVFLPVLHFVLVPALLAGGPLYAMVMMRERVTVLGADGDCPACGAAQHPKLKAGASASMDFRCEGCRRALLLKLPAELLAKDGKA
jgi:hypothetical protein